MVEGSGCDAPGFSTSSTWPVPSTTTLLRCGSRWHTSVAVLPEERCSSIRREKSMSRRISELWTMKGPRPRKDSAFLSAPPVPRIGSSGKKMIRSRQGDVAAQARSRSAFQCRLRSEEHTSELQSRPHLVCRLLLEKKKNKRLIVIFVIASEVRQ